MKTINLNLVNIVLIAFAALAVSLLIAKPIVNTHRDASLFVLSEEIFLPKPIAKTITKPNCLPVSIKPLPTNIAPLPILPPRITFQVMPLYPVSALQQGCSGITVLSVLIGVGGNAEKVELKASSGIAEMDESAVKAISQWKFSSATQGGAAIASWLEVPVHFLIKD